jgi:asparagine synthetase B (glutamine-hydrolysing)
MLPAAGLFGVGGKAYPFTDWRRDVLEPEFVVSANEITEGYKLLLGECARTDFLDQAQRTDLRVYMLEDILPKVDVMSMRCSLEVRSPFLDYRLVELALRIPSRLRIRAGRSKYLLRRIAERKLPARTAGGVKKGFGVPLRKWLYESHDSARFHDCLVRPDSGTVDPFRAGGAERLWQMGKGNPHIVPYVYCALTYRWWASQHRK